MHRPVLLRPCSRSRASRLAAVVVLALASMLAGPEESAATMCVTSDEPPLPMLLSPVGRPLPGEGTLLVQYLAADPLPAFELRRGRRRIPMTAETLAPGLFRLRPERPPSPGSWKLHVPARQRIQLPAVIGKGKLIPAETKKLPLTIELTGKPVPAVASAPSVEKAVFELWRWHGHRSRVYAILSAPVPRDAVAVIGMWPAHDRPAGPPGPATARTLTPDGAYVLVQDSRDYACALPPPGGVSPHESALARLALVDRFGRVIPLAGEHRLELVDVPAPNSGGFVQTP